MSKKPLTAGTLGLCVWLMTGWSPVLAVDPRPAEPVEANADASPDSDSETAARDDDDEPRKTEYVKVDARSIPKSNTIGTKLPVDLQETPFHVGVVGSQLIYEQGSTSLSQSLANISGLNPQGGTGVFDYYTMRGFDFQSSSTLMFDGVIEPESGYYNLYNAAAVEVLKGPAGFLYGNSPFHGAVAGAVNVVRKQPTPGKFGSVRASAGSFETYEAAVDWNVYRGDSFGFRVNAFYNESERYRDRQDSEQSGINPSFAFRFGDNTRMNVNLEFVDSEFTPDTGIPLFNNEIPDVPRTVSYQSGMDFSDQETIRLQVDLEHDFSDSLTLRNKTYYRSLEWNTVGTLFGAVAPVPPTFDVTVFRLLNTLDDDQTLIGNQLELVAQVETGAIKHQIVAGVETLQYEDDFRINFAQFDAVPLSAPVADTGAPAPFFVPFQGGSNETTVVAPYVVDRIEFSPVVAVTVGARYDNIDFEDPDAFIGNGQGGVINTPIDRSDGELSPMAAVTIAPSADVAVYVNAGETFSPAGPRVLGDQSPQEGRQAEMGIKALFADGRGRFSGAVYAIELENTPLTDSTGLTQLAGDQLSRGIELEVAADVGEGWRVFGSYAFNQSELTDFVEFLRSDSFGQDVNMNIDRSGNDAPFAPKHLVSSWVNKRFNRNWAAGGGVRYVDEQFIDEDNAFAIQDYFRVDAVLMYDRPAWRVRLNLENLTDEDYEVRGFATNVGSVIPAPGFTARAEVEFQF